jgi:hypothetical protein
MATATDTLSGPVPQLSATPRLATSRAMTILLAINAIPLLVLPIVIGLVNGRQYNQTDLLPHLLLGLISILPAQLFLLAFWMAFGAWPNRWRSVSIFAITVICGLYFGLSFATVSLITIPTARQPDAWIMIFVVIVMTPIMTSGLLWMLSAIFIIPAWCFGYEINHRSSAPPTQRPIADVKRTFSLLQLIIWTAQVALPLGALNLFLTITLDRAAALRMIVPFLVVLISGTPLAVALLAPRLSRGPIVLACTWCLVVALAIWTIPGSQYDIVPFQAVFIFALTIATNLLALRQLGFRWQPRAA